jgi:thiol-disulfide isomerase/thioredoxin
MVEMTRSRSGGRSHVRSLWLGLALIFAIPLVGRAGEPLLVRDMDGVQHDLDAVLASGERVALVFWQTWCPSCKREAPELVQAVRDQAGTVRFFGVISGPDASVDDDKVRTVARDWHYEHAQIRDRDLALTHRFKVAGTPVIIVLGQDQQVLYRGFRLPKSWEAYRESRADEGAALDRTAPGSN